jgi:hypothetical protein
MVNTMTNLPSGLRMLARRAHASDAQCGEWRPTRESPFASARAASKQGVTLEKRDKEMQKQTEMHTILGRRAREPVAVG